MGPFLTQRASYEKKLGAPGLHRRLVWLTVLAMSAALGVVTVGPDVATASASSDIRVSVYNEPGLNGDQLNCSNENHNLIGIINALPGYTVDGSIVDFIDRAGETTLAQQLADSTFFS
jgi:hypothetical protein